MGADTWMGAAITGESADLAPSAPSPLRVLQWNVLADGLAQHGDFIKVPSAALEWETRLPLILDEIEEASADICAIQELNRYEELRALLALRGYDGCFFPKHCSPASRYRCPADGLAIFYKKDRLEVAAQPAGTYFLDSKGRNMSQGFLRITLTDRLQGQQVVVVTTHLKAKQGQEMDSTRLSQVQQMLAGLGSDLQRPQAMHGASSPLPSTPSLPCPNTCTGTCTCQPANARHCSNTSAAACPTAGGASMAGRQGNSGGTYCSMAATDLALRIANVSGCASWGLPPQGNASGWAAQQEQLSDSSSAGEAAGQLSEGGVPGWQGNGTGHTFGNDRSSSGGQAGCEQQQQQQQQGLHLVPVIIAGDFNTIPTSAVCKMFQGHTVPLDSLWDLPTSASPYPAASYPLSTSSLHPASPSSTATSEACHHSYTEALPAAAATPSPLCSNGNGNGVPASLPSASASGEPTAAASGAAAGGVDTEFSTWKFRSEGESKRVIDYILWTRGRGLQPVARWRMLTEQEIGPTGLPTLRYPSDHVALCADFQWTSSQAATGSPPGPDSEPGPS
ncbi:hypothetical protein QJQ45_002391 [Haematococcus lacustris]|nr:hypothetical protein QJQ45_002391 [Haematococcus lacustris]